MFPRPPSFDMPNCIALYINGALPNELLFQLLTLQPYNTNNQEGQKVPLHKSAPITQICGKTCAVILKHSRCHRKMDIWSTQDFIEIWTPGVLIQSMNFQLEAFQMSYRIIRCHVNYNIWSTHIDPVARLESFRALKY